MKLAFAFAGQGAEQPRMGIEMAEAHEPARVLMREAGEPVLARLAEGRPFKRTSRLQPALTAICLGAVHALRERGIVPALVLGHSLGEIAAWSASGAIDPAAAVRLAAARGDAMEKQAALHPGGMLALRECDLATVAVALEAGKAVGELSVAAQNATDTWVLSGEDPALRAAARATLRLCHSVRLPVSGPWHARSMDGAKAAFEAALRQVALAPSERPMISNATGASADPEHIPRLLLRQIARPVRWSASMRSLTRLGVTDVITPGPAKVLRHLMRRALPAVRLHPCETPKDLERIVVALKPE